MKTSLRMRRGFVAVAAASILAGTFLVATPAMAVTGINGDFTYSYVADSGVAALTSYAGISTAEFTVPSLFTAEGGGEYVVTEIANGVSIAAATAVTVPATVSAIGATAFTAATALTDVYFLGNAPTLGSNEALGDAVTVHTLVGSTGFDSEMYENYTIVEAEFPSSGSNLYAQVLGGTRSASIGDVTFGSARFSHADQDIEGTAVLTVDDSTGTGSGWRVTVESSDLTWRSGSGSANLTTIPAANLSLQANGSVVRTAGTTDATATNQIGILSGPVRALYAGERAGEGTYELPLKFVLTVPADSHTGVYTGVLTTTMSINPL